MRSRNTLIWVGAVASAAVVAGASALYWTKPGFLWRNLGGAPVVASAPAEPKPPTAPPAVPTTPPAASAPAPADKNPTQAASSSLKPTFDVVNVDPSGEAVIAGRAAPNEKVELRDGSNTVGEATADAAGQFVIIPPDLAPGDHSLQLAAGDSKGHSETSITLAVSVPAQEAKAAAPPTNAKPAPPAPAMQTVATPPLNAGSLVAIHAVEADAAGGLTPKAWPKPTPPVRFYPTRPTFAAPEPQRTAAGR